MLGPAAIAAGNISFCSVFYAANEYLICFSQRSTVRSKKAVKNAKKAVTVTSNVADAQVHLRKST